MNPASDNQVFLCCHGPFPSLQIYKVSPFLKFQSKWQSSVDYGREFDGVEQTVKDAIIHV